MQPAPPSITFAVSADSKAHTSDTSLFSGDHTAHVVHPAPSCCSAPSRSEQTATPASPTHYWNSGVHPAPPCCPSPSRLAQTATPAPPTPHCHCSGDLTSRSRCLCNQRLPPSPSRLAQTAKLTPLTPHCSFSGGHTAHVVHPAPTCCTRADSNSRISNASLEFWSASSATLLSFTFAVSADSNARTSNTSLSLLW